MTDQATPSPETTPESPTTAWTPPTYEFPATHAVPEPVQPTPATKPAKGGRLRWAAAVAVIAIVLGATVAVASLLIGAPSPATVLRYVPADSVVYGELRLDLPGDQRQAAGAFLSKFPGFADQAALETKLDEALDQLIGNASDGKQTFSKDIKPWFDGEFAFAVGPLPADVFTATSSVAAPDVRALMLLSVKDQAAASTWFKGILSDTGTTSTTETYNGTELTVIKDPNGGSMAVAVAILGGNVAVAGDVASVKAAVDTKGTTSLASNPEFKAAADASTKDTFGFAYINIKSLFASMLDASSALGTGVPAIGDSLKALVPDWLSYSLRIEPDALMMTAASPHIDRGYGPTTNRPNQVVDHVPSTALALVSGNEVGSTFVGGIDLLGKEPSMKDAVTSINEALGVFGGTDAALGWIGDAGLVVNQAGTTLEGGLVIVPTDGAKATQFFTTLKSFIALGGSSAGLTVRDEAYGDAMITIVSADIGTLGGLVGGMTGGAMDGLPLPKGKLDLAYTVTDGVVVIGSSPDFVKHVLDTNAATSIASTDSFKNAVGRLSNDVTGLTYLDITSIRTLAEGTMSGDELARYSSDIKPYLEPFDALADTTKVGGDVDTETTVITVK